MRTHLTEYSILWVIQRITICYMVTKSHINEQWLLSMLEPGSLWTR
jgi:hypothetical protein